MPEVAFSILRPIGNVTGEELKSKLGSRRYSIALLRWGKGMTQEEIADELGLKQPTVSYHLKQTMQLFPALSSNLDGRHRTWRESDFSGFIAAYRMN